MTITVDKAVPEKTPRAPIFSRILVGIDESSESLEAARQAAILSTGPVTMLAAYDLTHALVGGVMPPGPVHYDEAPFREEAEKALEAARQELGTAEPVGKIGRGRSWEVLLEEIDREQNTLVVVGSHGAGRAKGILIGSTATELVHKAPCCGPRRPEAAEEPFPARSWSASTGRTSRPRPTPSPKTSPDASTRSSSATRAWPTR